MKFASRFIAAFLAILALAGCAAKSVRTDFAFNNEKDEGIVVFSVSHDSVGPQGTKAIFYMDGGMRGAGSTVFYSIDETIPGVIKASEFNDSHGHLVVLALPPGQHAIDYWQVTNGTGLRIFPKDKPTPLVFEVVAGKVKYIGNLHANLHTAKNIFGITITANGYPEIRDQRVRDVSAFETKYPQFKEKAEIELLPTGPWLKSFETNKKVKYWFPSLSSEA